MHRLLFAARRVARTTFTIFVVYLPGLVRGNRGGPSFASCGALLCYQRADRSRAFEDVARGLHQWISGFTDICYISILRGSQLTIQIFNKRAITFFFFNRLLFLVFKTNQGPQSSRRFLGLASTIGQWLLFLILSLRFFLRFFVNRRKVLFT